MKKNSRSNLRKIIYNIHQTNKSRFHYNQTKKHNIVELKIKIIKPLVLFIYGSKKDRDFLAFFNLTIMAA